MLQYVWPAQSVEILLLGNLTVQARIARRFFECPSFTVFASLTCCLLVILFCKAICSAIGFGMCDRNKAEIDIDIDKKVKKKKKKYQKV